MNTSTVASLPFTSGADPLFYGNSPKKELSHDRQGSPGRLNARLSAEYYKSTSMEFSYTSKDGDTVSFSMESVEYSKQIMDVEASGSEEDMKKLVDFIKESYQDMKKDLIKAFLKSTGVDVAESDVDVPKEIKAAEVPEYWNAENTSQRIVDFATSFFNAFEGAGEEFLATIKDAIGEGFKQAREMLGELPSEVNQLVDDTYSLVMEKLSAWAINQGIESTDQQQIAA